MKLLTFALVATGALAQTTPPTGIDYEAVLADLWTQTDTDGDGVLSQAEFTAAIEKLGVTVGTACSPACTLTNHTSVAALFQDLDTGGDGISPADLAGAVSRYPQYAQPLISAFTNGAGEVPTSMESVMPTAAMNTAAATVEVSMVVSGPPSAIYPGTREKIRLYFATQAGVEPANVVLTFTAVAARRALQRAKSELRRHLQTATSTNINATIFVPDEASAVSATANFEADIASGVGAVPAFEGLNIESVQPIAAAPRVPAINAGAIAGAAIVLVLLLPIFLCVVAGCWAKKNTAKLPAEPKGCCANGCCSFNAVGPWATGEFLAAAFILGFMFMLYSNMDAVIYHVTGLVTTFNALVLSPMPQVQSFVAGIPPDVITVLRDNVAQIKLLNIAVVVPGVLAGLFLLLAAICPLMPMHKGSYCFTKCYILLAKLFLLVAIVFYIIMAAVGSFLAWAPTSVPTAYGTVNVQANINMMRGACVTVPAEANQMITDNSAALSQLEAAGQDVADFRATLNEMEAFIGLVDSACTHMEGFMVSIFDIFLPSILCVIAIVYSFFVNQTLCCAAGCCKAPPTEASKPPGAKTMTGVGEMEVTVAP